ncbi:MAG: PDZ domain-containing protein, partial [Planctomycetota bacterium]|nr:PDZ domain-containing protein [Planctomycetota bacterium]
MQKILPLALLFCTLATAQDNARQEDGSATSSYQAHQVAGIPWRNIGPANMGGRITDIAVPAKDISTWYIATAGGGLWKTVNRGTTWTAQFQHQPTVSLGDVAVAPSNLDTVWVGTGEENARNSVSFGDGVYKSTDGGSTWKHMGLEKTFQIGHIAIHPKDENTVFVAALGRLWGPNPERGIYRTRDGGNTWQKVLYIDTSTGCIDLRIDPNRPRTVYAAMYERERDMFDSNDPAVRFGEGSGFFRSDDGGDTWKKLTRGLPTCKWGRSAFSLFNKKPGTLFAIIETERSGWGSGTQKARQATGSGGSAYMGISGKDGENGAVLSAVTPGGPSAKAGLKTGDLITKMGDKNIAAYADLIAAIRNASGGDKTK